MAVIDGELLGWIKAYFLQIHAKAFLQLYLGERLPLTGYNFPHLMVIFNGIWSPLI